MPSGPAGKPQPASGRALIVAMLVLIVCDVIGGFLAVASGVDTWDEAWGFNTEFTVPLPVGAAQLVLAWLAARNVRPPVGLVAAVLLSAFCLISLMFGLFDGDLINNVASAGWAHGGSSGESSCCRSPPLSVCSPPPGRGSCTGFADGPVFRLADTRAGCRTQRRSRSGSEDGGSSAAQSGARSSGGSVSEAAFPASRPVSHSGPLRDTSVDRALANGEQLQQWRTLGARQAGAAQRRHGSGHGTDGSIPAAPGRFSGSPMIWLQMAMPSRWTPPPDIF